MKWNPQPHQEKAMAFALDRPGCGLLLDPGLGKTSITLAVILLCKDAGEVRKTLVVAPLRVCKTVWPVEARKWDEFHGLKVVVLCDMTEEERTAAMAGPGDIFVCHPEIVQDRSYTHPKTKVISLTKGVFSLLTREFDLLVVDESTKFKDTQSARFKALKRVLPNFKRRMILTGTPVPNGVADLFGQMYIVDYGESLGKFITHFRVQFMHQRPGNQYAYFLNPGSEDMIYRRVASKLLRMDAVDHLDMPALIESNIMVDFPTLDLRRQYDKLEDDFLTEVGGDTVVVFNAAALGTKLRQFANGFLYHEETGTVSRSALYLHEEKLDALEGLVEEMQGRPLLVGYEFQEDARRILERFPQAIDLGAARNPEGVVAAFNKGDVPILLAHPASAGHGLNLQEACNTVCWYSPTWNLEHRIQFIARVWRQGQKASAVVVHNILTRGTKDEDVTLAVQKKDVTQTRFNDAIKSNARRAVQTL